MELLAPRALWLLTLLGPLVVLYVLKVRRRRQRVASVWLWQAARRELTARSPFKRLVAQLPLLLEGLCLVALAIAAATPATRSREIAGEHVALVIDTSASMSARDPVSGKTRIELAQDAAREVIASMRPGSDAMILDAGRSARVALPPDRDHRRLHGAIDELVAHPVAGDLEAAVALAVSRLEQSGGARQLVVITDGNLARPAPLDALKVPVEVVRVGAPIDNLAIVRVDVRTGVDPVVKTEQLQAFVLVASYASAPREIYVTMRQHNASDVLASRHLTLAPGAREPVVLTFTPTAGDLGRGLVFELSPHDDMPIDDVAYGRIPLGRSLPVVVAHAAEPSPWLLRALASDEHAVVVARPLATVEADTALDHGTLMVVQGACPRALGGGDLLLVDPPPGPCLGAVVGETLAEPRITSWARADPRLRFVSLDGVLLEEARALRAESASRELIRASGGVIAADASTSARSVTLLGFDVGRTNWPLRASFVLFVRNVMEQARLHRSEGVAGPVEAGTPLRAAVPAPVHTVTVADPAGNETRLAARDGLVVVPHTEALGLYRISWDEPRHGSFWAPVNLTAAAESDLGPPESDAATGSEAVVAAGSTVPPAHQSYDWLLAIAALALVVGDVWYLTRRPRAPRKALVS